MKFDALKNRHSLKQTKTSKSQNKQIVIQKSEKDNSIVIVNRNKYIEKIENFLSDKSKFQKTAVKNDNFLNFITSQEKHIDKIFKKFMTLPACLKKLKTSEINQWELDLK